MAQLKLKNRTAEIINLKKNGVTNKEIAAKFHISPERVRQIGNANGFPSMTRTGLLKRNKLIAELLKKGKTPEQIASLFPIHVNTIVHLARQFGVITPLQKKHRQRNLAIIAALKKGITPGKATALFKMSKSNILRIANIHGIRIKPPSKGPVIVKMLKDGISAIEIAKKLSITRQAVYFHKRKMTD